ncbi:hypothetical protein WMY93_001620 [Mugilogobius chulae]|uniref:Uncharacterized protein n=1 Tax=Mugilogobius chulae TaxID=88201 RepID=A0AAW0Q2E6_9GOBI
MKHLGRGNVKHPDVFDKGLATHVVSGILYGAQAFFVFDREVSKTENQQDVEGNVQAIIKKIPSFSIEGKGELKMNDEDKASVDKFSYAVEVYQSLPKLLKESDVPVKVWLLPLTTLDSAAARLVREISVHLVKEAQSVLEDFNDLELRCNDALKTKTVGLSKLLARKLPAIRGGGEEEAGLADVLRREPLLRSTAQTSATGWNLKKEK